MFYHILAGDFFNQNLQLDSIVGSPMSFGGGSHGMRGGIRDDPTMVRRILGSTVAGRELRMGERGKNCCLFPQKKMFRKKQPHKI